jgi:DNA-binding NarL/FixJ family response regulator
MTAFQACGSHICVLLVEDLVGDATAITRALSYSEASAGLEIKRATRLQESINAIQQNKIDVVLLDLSLPDAKDIKAVVELNRLFPTLPIIVISDQSDERIIKRALDNGACKFLSKSESSGILIRKTINDVLAMSARILEKADGVA